MEWLSSKAAKQPTKSVSQSVSQLSQPAQWAHLSSAQFSTDS